MSKTVNLNIPRTAAERVAKTPLIQPGDEQMRAALSVLNQNGFNISAPWDGDLDDLENERFQAVRDAIGVVLRMDRERR